MKTLLKYLVSFLVSVMIGFLAGVILIGTSYGADFCDLSIAPEQNPECYETKTKPIKIQPKKNKDKKCNFAYAEEQDPECFKEEVKPQKSNYTEKQGDQGYFCEFAIGDEDCNQ